MIGYLDSELAIIMESYCTVIPFQPSSKLQFHVCTKLHFYIYYFDDGVLSIIYNIK